MFSKDAEQCRILYLQIFCTCAFTYVCCQLLVDSNAIFNMEVLGSIYEIP